MHGGRLNSLQIQQHKLAAGNINPNIYIARDGCLIAICYQNIL